MKAKIIKSWRNQYCQDCGSQEPELVHVFPRKVKKEFKLCMSCFKKFFHNTDCESGI